MPWDVLMEEAVDKEHPRMKEGTLVQPFPLCTDTGRILTNATDQPYEFDQFGLAISNYFKILKSFGIFFIFCYLINWVFIIPVYQSGVMGELPTSTFYSFIFK